jgi:hypothetical protein
VDETGSDCLKQLALLLAVLNLWILLPERWIVGGSVYSMDVGFHLSNP